MNCPECATLLQMTERSGVEIDYCPQCRGVWLDRGEPDKILERSVVGRVPPVHSGMPIADQPDRRRSDDDHHGDRNDHHDDRVDDDRKRGLFGRDPRRRSRGGLLGELFDF